MALHKAIEQARRQTATRANRQRQQRAELRLEEIVKVAGLSEGVDEYEAIDRAEDLAMESHFARLYQLADDDEEREAAVAAFMDWERYDKRHDANQRNHRGEIDGAVTLIKRHNPLFIEGAFVPAESDGAA